MENFKVICKHNHTTHSWARNGGVTKIVTTKRFFGLIKNTSVVKDEVIVPGPSKDEICIVYETYVDGDTYYKLQGYPYGGYNSKYFIRLDEFTETAKEIAKKSEPQLN